MAARVRGGLGEEYPAEIDQNTSDNHGRARKLDEDVASGGKTGRRTNAEASERELWWVVGTRSGTVGEVDTSGTRSATGIMDGSKVL